MNDELDKIIRVIWVTLAPHCVGCSAGVRGSSDLDE